MAQEVILLIAMIWNLNIIKNLRIYLLKDEDYLSNENLKNLNIDNTLYALYITKLKDFKIVKNLF